MRLLLTAATVCLLSFTSAASAQNEAVYRSLTTDQLENILKNASLDFKKAPAKSEGTFYYDYKKNNFSIRLYYYNGKDLMCDALFNEYPLEKINDWNVRAKFSRANRQKDDKGFFTVLESNLDVLGGVTETTIRHFLNTFDEELKSFSKFTGAAGGATDPVPMPPAGQEKIVKAVPAEMIEKVLDGLNLKFKKTQIQNGTGHFYDYSSKNFNIRLYNYGNDLMIDAVFKGLTLEQVNKYNTDRTFIRTVLYNDKMGDYTALECNLDCVGGVTESIVRGFITIFDEEVASFSKYVNNLPGAGAERR